MASTRFRWNETDLSSSDSPRHLCMEDEACISVAFEAGADESSEVSGFASVPSNDSPLATGTVAKSTESLGEGGNLNERYTGCGTRSCQLEGEDQLEGEADDAVAAEDEGMRAFEQLEERKEKLMDHLRHDIYCTIEQSELHGVGVKAVREIKKGVDPFRTNGPPSARTIDLTTREVNTLPKYVQNLIRRFFVPHKGSYPVPEAGLNTLDISYYLNSSKKAHVVHDDDDNMELGDSHDARGFTKLIASRDIEKGEELKWPYGFSGRPIGCLDNTGSASNLSPADVAKAGECRICRDPVDGATEVVDIGCACKGASRMHKKCADQWFSERLSLVFTQSRHESDKAGKVYDRWMADTTATCVCKGKVGDQFAREVMASVENLKKLHTHIVKKEPVSLQFCKIAESRVVRRVRRGGKSGSEGGRGEEYECVVRERVQPQRAGFQAREHLQERPLGILARELGLNDTGRARNMTRNQSSVAEPCLTRSRMDQLDQYRAEPRRRRQAASRAI